MMSVSVQYDKESYVVQKMYEAHFLHNITNLLCGEAARTLTERRRELWHAF
jgi:hypothetical protein